MTNFKYQDTLYFWTEKVDHMNENLGLYNLIYLDSQNPKDPNGASDFQYLGTLVCSLKSPTIWSLKSNPEDPNGASNQIQRIQTEPQTLSVSVLQYAR